MSRFFKTVPAVFCFLFFLTGCTISKPVLQQPISVPSEEKVSTLPQVVQPPETQRKSPSPGPIPTPRPSPSPRARASLELTKQAQLLIESGKPDKAIRILERAVNLYPGSGENYYYLAEAWFMKGNPSQAKEYNTLAAIRFKDDHEWTQRIFLQKKRIDRTGKTD